MLLYTLAQAYFHDLSLDEVLINSCDQALLLGGGARRVEASPFSSATAMIQACQALAFSQSLRLDPLVPAAGGSLEVFIGSELQHFRWHCLIPPVSRDGPLLSLRRHRLTQLALADFVGEESMAVLASTASQGGPLFIAGPTGAGKTSLMMTLLQLQADALRVAILEQTAELPRLKKGWIRLQAQASDLSGRGAFSLSQGFDELLRLRPDRIVIGELRQRDEVRAIRRAIFAGHGSVWATIHTSSALDLAARLADMAQEELGLWQSLLEIQEAQLVIMGREFPRVRSIWQFRSGTSPIKKAP